MNEETPPPGPPLGIDPTPLIVGRGLHGAAGRAEAEGGDLGLSPQAPTLPTRIDLAAGLRTPAELAAIAAERDEPDGTEWSQSAWDAEDDDETNGYGALAAGQGGSGSGGGGTGGGPPPSSGASSPASVPGVPASELDLFEHLAELRRRILRAFSAIGIALIGTWTYREPILTWFSAPISREIKHAHGILITITPTEGFGLYLQTSFVAAVIIAMPVVLYQLWAFIEPALTRKERRYGIVLVPFSVGLFFIGAAFGFFLTPLFFRFFLQYQPPGSLPNWRFGDAAVMLGKMLLCFGICFQVPVVTIFVNKIGLVSRNWMIEYWRHVVVVIFTVVAIITPTWDPLTLCVAATPPCLLYGLSIWLVKWL